MKLISCNFLKWSFKNLLALCKLVTFTGVVVYKTSGIFFFNYYGFLTSDMYILADLMSLLGYSDQSL